jgi:hypothetical protein
MKFNRWFFSGLVTLSVCFGQDLETSNWNQGMLRAALRFAVEVPITTVAINTVPNVLTSKQSIENIFKHKGILGFYSGTPIEFLRSLLWHKRMQLMNDPWRIGIPTCEWEMQKQASGDEDSNGSYLEVTLIPREYDRSLSIAANLGAFEMAYMPLFRMRTACMLSTIREIRENMARADFSLYSGGYLRGVATFASWYSFFKAQDFANKHLSDHSFAQIGLVTASQAAVGAVTSPLYVVMINRQKLTDPCALPFFDSTWKTYQLHGSQVFWRAAKFGAGHSAVQAALTAGVMKCFEEKND